MFSQAEFSNWMNQKYANQTLAAQAGAKESMAHAALYGSQAATNPEEAASREAAQQGAGIEGRGMGAYYSKLNAPNSEGAPAQTYGEPVPTYEGDAKGKTRVPGKGDPRVDSQPAMLAPGEAVLNAPAAEHLGRDVIDLLNAIGQRKLGMSDQSAVSASSDGDSPNAQPATQPVASSSSQTPIKAAKGTANVPAKIPAKMEAKAPAKAPAKTVAPGAAKGPAKGPAKAGFTPGGGLTPGLLAALLQMRGIGGSGMGVPQAPMPMPMPHVAAPQMGPPPQMPMQAAEGTSYVPGYAGGISDFMGNITDTLSAGPIGQTVRGLTNKYATSPNFGPANPNDQFRYEAPSPRAAPAPSQGRGDFGASSPVQRMGQ